MPDGVNGHELALQLAAAKPSLKVIFTSGYTSAFGDLPLADHVRFLPKPYKIQTLAKSVRDCLDQPLSEKADVLRS
jgi:DNA-binding LytR/AlgR family response regulator